MKKSLTLLAVFTLLFCCSGCRTYADVHWNLSSQLGACWKSEDGTITIRDEGDEKGGLFLYLMHDQEQIRLCFDEAIGGFVTMRSEDKAGIFYTEEDICEIWRCSYKSKKKFVATVEETTYFEVGQKITFHRVYPK